MTATATPDFGAIYRFRPLVESYLRRRGVGADDAADLASEVFTIAWQRRDELPAIKSVKAWLLVTARNVLSNHQRKQIRDRNLLDAMTEEYPVDNWVDAFASQTDHAQTRAVYRALAALNDTDRELLLLTAWDGLTPLEAARSLDLSRGSLRVRLHRARKRFAAALDIALEAPSASPPVGLPAATSLTLESNR